MNGKLPHSTVSVGERPFLGTELMLDQERALADSPQRNSPWELAHERLLVAGEREQLAGPFGLPGGLGRR
jgi:hypothetical protein